MLVVAACVILAAADLRGPSALGAETLALAYTPDGKQAATADGCGRITLWDLNARKAAWEAWVRRPDGAQGYEQQAVRAMAFSANGRQVASGGNDGKVRLWDRQTGKLVRELARPNHVG
jgi:WD40 repeat protein